MSSTLGATLRVVRVCKRGKQAVFDRLPLLKLRHEKSRYAVH
jgi:hypothetical protein